MMLALALFAAGGAMAQMNPMQPIPADKDLRTGKLENGLTYYIRHNEKPKGQADFYILHDVGAIQEDDDQQGLAHFLEHMAFNGTKNLPGKQMIEYLETVGVKFGYNLNAATSWDYTVYNISDVPTARQGSSTRPCSYCTTGRTSSHCSPRRSTPSAESSWRSCARATALRGVRR